MKERSGASPPTMAELKPWQWYLYVVIFQSSTREGKIFDIALLIAIIVSVGLVMLESVKSLAEAYGFWFNVSEWFFTILFSIEYILRLISIGKPLRYVFSFFGIIDLLSILPTYLSLFIAGAPSLIVIRALRLLRIFRVLKLARFMKEAKTLRAALAASRPKITVFLFAVFTSVIVMGTLMYLIEDPEAGFTSIPRSIYWAIVTLTTVGYGDIAPATPLGQALASLIMIIGYGIIAVPTGIVGAEMARSRPELEEDIVCWNCTLEGHGEDAVYCRNCGAELNAPPQDG